MADLHVRGVDDETKGLLDRIAADQGVSTAEYVRQVLKESVAHERRRRAMAESFARMADLRVTVAGVTSDTGVEAVRAVRDDFERHGSGAQ